jgi:hypothetical protein
LIKELQQASSKNLSKKKIEEEKEEKVTHDTLHVSPDT